MTDTSDTRDAWFETQEGRAWPLGSSCSIGRAPNNHIVLTDNRVSRRHAMVHRQDTKEYWIVDLGSGNGSFVNGLRVALPTRLNDGDAVRIGGTEFRFRQMASGWTRPVPAASSPLTLIEMKSVACWMLVADIVGSTGLALKYAPERWASLVGAWAQECRRVVEKHDGVINKYLGDGFLAIWPREAQQTQTVAGALDRLLSMQKGAHLPFRLALHYGEVLMGGGRSLGEESLSGLELVLLFRMEKIAGKLNRTFLCSEPAAARLKPHVQLEFVGEHAITGFIDGQPRRFFGLAAK